MKKYIFDGKELNESADTQRAALTRCTAICTIAETDQEQEIYGFQEENNFQRWARGQRFAAKIEQTNELIARAREQETGNHERVIGRQQILNQGTLSGMRELAQQSGLNPSSKELFDLAHSSPSLLEPPILQSAVLFDSSPSGGLLFVLPVGIPIPTLGNANDRASYMTLVGFATLSDKTWWRGDKAYFITNLHSITFELAAVGFNNRTSSGACV